ncbi:MAG: cytochrome c biogenesis protein CcsA [Alphaproteobacteria bacterium]|nr:cytochrome c biogenesis protein CcsA [Alphaproteobacteria bacterium]
MILTIEPLIGWLAGWAAIFAYALVAWRGGAWGENGSQRLMTLAWLLHAFAVWGSLGSELGAPRFGFAPALSATAWLVLTFYTLERHWFPQWGSRLILSGLGGVTVALSLIFPGQPLDLQASAWLSLHLMFGISAYGLFAAAVVHAVLMTRTERLIRQAVEVQGTLPLLVLERLTFRFVYAGFALLTATLAMGVVFGEELYGPGHAWRWDHKTVFALLSWLTFAALLWARFRLGWRGRKALRVLYVGAGLLLLSYVGSRFVMEVLLGRGGA